MACDEKQKSVKTRDKFNIGALPRSATCPRQKHVSFQRAQEQHRRYWPCTVLGGGAYGDVYLCWDAHERKHVAIKQFIQHSASDLPSATFRELAILKGMAERAASSGESLSLDSRVRDSINRIEAQVLALEMLLLRVAADASAEPGPQASILKIRGSEIQQDLARLQMQVAGPDAWQYDPEWLLAESAFHGPGPEYSAAAAAGYFDMRKTSIYGGTTEVQKGIIAKQIIGV